MFKSLQAKYLEIKTKASLIYGSFQADSPRLKIHFREGGEAGACGSLED